MKKNKNMKNQKGFIQIPLLVVIVSLVILVGAGVLFPRAIGAPTFNLSPILFPLCIPKDGPDPETGCRACGDNARIEYEQCRQSYYLKKQAQLLEAQQISQKTLTEKEQTIIGKEQTITELESKNRELQELLEGQNKQIQELIQGLEQQSQGIDTLMASLKNAKSLNIGLSIISVVFLICLILLFVKKRRKKL